jgi:hypothetical protein
MRAKISGNEPGAETATRFALQFGEARDRGPRIDTVRRRKPVAADDLHVGAAACRHHRASGTALEAVEFAREQRLECNRVVLELHELELEAELARKLALRRHEQNARIALRFERAMPPRPQALGRRCPGRNREQPGNRREEPQRRGRGVHEQ